MEAEGRFVGTAGVRPPSLSRPYRGPCPLTLEEMPIDAMDTRTSLVGSSLSPQPLRFHSWQNFPSVWQGLIAGFLIHP